MLNRNPIFVNGFSRGGTTILTNLLASHPDVCLIGETHHAFKGTSITDSRWRVLAKCLRHDVPIIFRQGQDFFSPRLIKPRKPLSDWSKSRIDRILYQEKLRSIHPYLNRYQTSSREYSPGEIATARLLCKNIDGMIYSTNAWYEMYPDATFFGLVRNGLAVCEGHIRRGRSANDIGRRYRLLVDKMLADSSSMPRYIMVRFEDIVSSPWDSLEKACAHADLDASQISEVRMQVRRYMDSAGNHCLNGSQEWDVTWLSKSSLAQYFDAGVDDNQIRRLSDADRQAFLDQAGEAMERLGYSTSADWPATYSLETHPARRRGHRNPPSEERPGIARAA